VGEGVAVDDRRDDVRGGDHDDIIIVVVDSGLGPRAGRILDDLAVPAGGVLADVCLIPGQGADVLSGAQHLADGAPVPAAALLVATLALRGGLEAASMQFKADAAKRPAAVGNGVEHEPHGLYLLLWAVDAFPGDHLALVVKLADDPQAV